MHKVLLAVAAAATSFTLSSNIQAQEDAQEMLALNLYHEARGEGREGMVAVGWVVLNRVKSSEYPNEVVAVITQKRGNSCEWGWWCDGKSDKPTEAEKWDEAQAIAGELLSDDRPEDPTGGALWFQESFRDRPRWMGDHIIETATIGAHNFFGLAQ